MKFLCHSEDLTILLSTVAIEKKLHSIKYYVLAYHFFLNTAIITLGIDHAALKAFQQSLLFLVLSMLP